MRPEVPPGDPLVLVPSRVHEAAGAGPPGLRAVPDGPPSRALSSGSCPPMSPELPLPSGLPRGVGERLVLLRPKGETDLLWAVEEALRSRRGGAGHCRAAAAVVADRRAPAATGRRGRPDRRADADPAGTRAATPSRAGGAARRLASSPDSTLHRVVAYQEQKGNIGNLDLELEWRVGCFRSGFRGWPATQALRRRPLEGAVRPDPAVGRRPITCTA